MLGIKPYKIYEYYSDIDVYVKLLPQIINFKTGLTRRLHPEMTFVQGELVEVTHWAEVDVSSGSPVYSVPVVRETWAYTRDETGYASQRVHTIRWAYDDGTWDDVNVKTRVKYYDSLTLKREESSRRRRNQTTKASETVIGALMAGGMSYANAVSEGFTYWRALTDVGAVSHYEEGSPDDLINRISTDTEPAWLPSIRNYILAEL